MHQLLTRCQSLGICVFFMPVALSCMFAFAGTYYLIVDYDLDEMQMRSVMAFMVRRKNE